MENIQTKSFHMLAIDDEEDALVVIRQLFRKEIRKGEIQLDCALNAGEALDFLGNQQTMDIVLILSDINMPGMSGIDLVKVIRERWSNPPPFVFVISAYDSRAKEARSVGADDFFTKPLDVDMLKTRVLELKKQLWKGEKNGC